MIIFEDDPIRSDGADPMHFQFLPVSKKRLILI